MRSSCIQVGTVLPVVPGRTAAPADGDAWCGWLGLMLDKVACVLHYPHALPVPPSTAAVTTRVEEAEDA